MTIKDNLLIGIARIKDIREKIATTTTALSLSPLYDGVTMLNSELNSKEAELICFLKKDLNGNTKR